ncbi:hypothetical protein [Erythrobacter sp.]|uniref:hypothetical protein n=1 Tax=Erythrobacter sp. TaxID=1042 RepID=UPI001425C16D|nr:hypothetical protein [Erythrobacter sp.]QIQ85966.1 MAG: hypothetical protein G9473_04175 [Erythrobacter sp.]
MNAASIGSALSLRGLRRAFAAGALALLAVPLVAMQFTGEVDWGPGDFLVAAALLAALWAGVELALRAFARPAGRIAGIALSAFGFLAVWAELAVVIFD